MAPQQFFLQESVNINQYFLLNFSSTGQKQGMASTLLMRDRGEAFSEPP
jgi:hypothetical protein